jgi:hypothetical protein
VVASGVVELGLGLLPSGCEFPDGEEVVDSAGSDCSFILLGRRGEGGGGVEEEEAEGLRMIGLLKGVSRRRRRATGFFFFVKAELVGDMGKGRKVGMTGDQQ